MNNILKSFIEKKIPLEKFNINSVIHSEEKVTWVPLMSFGEHQTVLGLSKDAEWVMNEKEGLRKLDETWKFLRLLVLLEQPRKKVYDSLQETLEGYEIFVDVDDFFPFIEIVKIGLEQKSDYWAELAINWFSDLPLLKQKELLESVRKISDARWASQKIRHKVMKELRKVEKS